MVAEILFENFCRRPSPCEVTFLCEPDVGKQTSVKRAELVESQKKMSHLADKADSENDCSPDLLSCDRATNPIPDGQRQRNRDSRQ